MSERFVTRAAVFIILRNKDGQILLQQRANTGYLDGYWDFPSGHLERGESIHEAAVRELAEEVGITISVDELRLVHIDQYLRNDADYINFAFIADHWSGEPKIGEPDKCSAIGWFAGDALPEKCTNNVRVNERTKFSNDLTYSVTTEDTYNELIDGTSKKE